MIDSASVSTRGIIEHVARWGLEGHAMILVRLTYFSRNHIHRLGGPTDDRIHDILIESVANNRRDDVIESRATSATTAPRPP